LLTSHTLLFSYVGKNQAVTKLTFAIKWYYFRE